MVKPLEIRGSGNGWTVQREGASRVLSRHRTKAEAVDAGRRSALRMGGGEVRIHSRDGRLVEVDRVGETTGSSSRTGKRTAASRSPTSQAAQPRASRERAFPTQGPRTTLRVPEHLVNTADRLAEELGTSRNDALVRLAARGAEAYEREARIARRREDRWAAVLGGRSDLDQAQFPSEAEARRAASALRKELLEPDVGP